MFVTYYSSKVLKIAVVFSCFVGAINGEKGVVVVLGGGGGE